MSSFPVFDRSDRRSIDDAPPGTPARIARLPRDKRGFPIPQAVKREPDGTPHLAIIDPARAAALHETHSCGICGEKLPRLENWFVGAPSDVRKYGWRVFSDPPMHEECVAFAMRTCPYLAALSYLKQPRRPAVFVTLMTRRYQYDAEGYRLEDGLYPQYSARRPWRQARWWRGGRELTDPHEILQNINKDDRRPVARFLGVDFQEAP